MPLGGVWQTQPVWGGFASIKERVSGDHKLDVVVFGATGFVGRLLAGYLAGHAPGGVRIGLAGRSERRLADVRAGLGGAASAWPLLVADSADPVSVSALARAARVVVSTAGPYRAQGLPLVAACAGAGTDYADLAGEVLFIRDSIDPLPRHRGHGRARGSCAAAGSTPVPFPTSGVLLLHHAARADDAGDLPGTTPGRDGVAGRAQSAGRSASHDRASRTRCGPARSAAG